MEPESNNKKVSPMEEFVDSVENIKTTDTVTLPSKGLVYKPEENIPASITIRRMTTKEDKMRLRNQSDTVIMKDILQACILNENLDAGNLKLMDANYLLFRLRIISLLNDTYKVRCTCPYCNSVFVHQLNLNEVPVNYLDEEKLSLMQVQLPISKMNVDFKYPSLNQMIQASERYKEYMNMYPNADVREYMYSFTPSLYIDKVNNKTLMSIEVEDMLNNIDILDSRAIRDVVGSLSTLFGFDENLATVCPNCKKEVKHGLPITSELFSPSK